MKRRQFIKKSAQGSAALTLGATLLSCVESTNKSIMTNKTAPVAICTWGFTKANQAAGEALESGMAALDAAIKGVAVEEENIKNTTVGKGGAPDRE
ncbi:MAG: glycosylasparaginase, partial [Nonlabens ulvanivorans]